MKNLYIKTYKTLLPIKEDISFTKKTSSTTTNGMPPVFMERKTFYLQIQHNLYQNLCWPFFAEMEKVIPNSYGIESSLVAVIRTPLLTAVAQTKSLARN